MFQEGKIVHMLQDRPLLLVEAVRKSRLRIDDQTTSPERQQDTNRIGAARHGARIAHSAIDLNVSADKFPPWERPELKFYFTPQGAKTHDGFACAKFDRMFRSMSDMFKVCEWAAENRKVVLICETPMGGPLFLNFAEGPLNMMNRMMLILMAFIAEGEVQATKDRTREAAAFLRQVGRWGGGVHAHWLMPKKIDDADGWTLVLNPDTAPVMQEIIDRILNRESKTKIVEDLNERGVPSPREYLNLAKDRVPTAKYSGWIEVREKDFILHPDANDLEITIPIRPKTAVPTVKTGDRVRQGQRLVEPILWNVTSVTDMCRRTTLLGTTGHRSEPVLGPDGLPVKNCEALIQDRATWKRLQEALDKAANNVGVEKVNTAYLLDIGYCGVCDDKLWFRSTMKPQGLYAYYRCRGAWGHNKRQPKEERCKALSFRASQVEPVVERMLLRTIGDYEIMETITIPGESHEDELSEATDAWNDLTTKSAGKSAVIQAMYAKQISRLEAIIEDLSARPVVPERTELRPTGQTYRQVWESAVAQDARRTLLLDSGVRLGAMLKPEGGPWTTPPRIGLANEDDDVILVDESETVVVAMAIPRDIIRRSTHRDADLGFRDVPLSELSQDLSALV